MTFRKPIPENRCPDCWALITDKDIWFEPEEPSTGTSAYAETSCCGEASVAQGYPDLDERSDYKQVPLIKNNKLIDL